jgi:vacuolar-type H+-ATPase subunit D/Vma8
MTSRFTRIEERAREYEFHIIELKKNIAKLEARVNQIEEMTGIVPDVKNTIQITPLLPPPVNQCIIS